MEALTTPYHACPAVPPTHHAESSQYVRIAGPNHQPNLPVRRGTDMAQDQEDLNEVSRAGQAEVSNGALHSPNIVSMKLLQTQSRLLLFV